MFSSLGHSDSIQTVNFAKYFMQARMDHEAKVILQFDQSADGRPIVG